MRIELGDVRVPHIAELDPHSQFYTDGGCPRVFDLYAMTIHLGIMGGGHYVAYAKDDSEGKWWFFNDSSCKEVSDERVSKENGYVLFYRARNLAPSRFLPKFSRPIEDFEREDAELPQDADEDDYGRGGCAIC